MTVQVRDRHNRCYVAFEDKEQAKRKAMKNGPAKFTKDARKLQRPTFNSREGVTKFAEEFRRSPCHSVRIPESHVVARLRSAVS